MLFGGTLALVVVCSNAIGFSSVSYENLNCTGDEVANYTYEAQVDFYKNQYVILCMYFLCLFCFGDGIICLFDCL